MGKAAAIERDPHKTLTNESDFLIASLVFDPLTVPGSDPNVAPRLASHWTQLDDRRQWRFTIAPGATFHDGTAVRAEDVVWSLRRLYQMAGQTRIPVASADAITADGPHAVIVTTPTPNRAVPLLLRLMTFTMPAGTSDFARPVGSGPFQLQSYDDGSAYLTRHNRWHGGAARCAALEVHRFQSLTALTNAVLAGQIDVASNVGAVAGRIAQHRRDLIVVRRSNDVVIPIVMRTADGPFADPRVRTALRLAIDRSGMVARVASGYGSVAHDVLGTADPAFDTTLAPRTRDPARAQELLAAAGFDTSRRYRLCTKDEAVGEVDCAQLFATQVADIGVKIDVVVQQATVFYTDTWLKAPLYTVNWGTNDSVIFFADKTMRSTTEFNESAFHDPEFDAAYVRAVGATDEASYLAASREIQRIQYERGGYLVWGNNDGVDVASARVRDLPTLGGYGRVQLERTWLAP